MLIAVLQNLSIPPYVGVLAGDKITTRLKWEHSFLNLLEDSPHTLAAMVMDKMGPVLGVDNISELLNLAVGNLLPHVSEVDRFLTWSCSLIRELASRFWKKQPIRAVCLLFFWLNC